MEWVAQETPVEKQPVPFRELWGVWNKRKGCWIGMNGSYVGSFTDRAGAEETLERLGVNHSDLVVARMDRRPAPLPADTVQKLKIGQAFLEAVREASGFVS